MPNKIKSKLSTGLLLNQSLKELGDEKNLWDYEYCRSNGWENPFLIKVKEKRIILRSNAILKFEKFYMDLFHLDDNKVFLFLVNSIAEIIFSKKEFREYLLVFKIKNPEIVSRVLIHQISFERHLEIKENINKDKILSIIRDHFKTKLKKKNAKNR